MNDLQDHKLGRSPFKFFLLVFVISWLIWLPLILGGYGVDVGFNTANFSAALISIGAFGPLAAAVILVGRKHGRRGIWAFVRQAFDFRVSLKHYALALGVPLAVHAITHYTAPLLGMEVAETLFPAALPVPPLLLSVPNFFLMLFFGGGQEEFGWRGYAQQPLQARYGMPAASVLIGIVWGFWHLPLWLIPGDWHAAFPLPAFLVMTVSLSIVMAWIYNASGQKMITALLFHAMINTATPLLPYVHWIEGKPETATWLFAGVNAVAAVLVLTVLNKKNGAP